MATVDYDPDVDVVHVASHLSGSDVEVNRSLHRFLHAIFSDPATVDYICQTAKPDTVADLQRAETEAELQQWLPALNGCQIRKLWCALANQSVADSDSCLSIPDCRVERDPSHTLGRASRSCSMARVWPIAREHEAFMVETSHFFAPGLLWIDVGGEPPEKRPPTWQEDYSAYLEELAGVYRLHPASIKDCLSPSELPKTEFIGGVTFCLMRYCVDDVLAAEDDDIADISAKLVVIITTHPSARDVDVVIAIHLHPLRPTPSSAGFQGYYEMQSAEFRQSDPVMSKDHLVNILFDDVLDTYAQAIHKLRLQVDHYESCLARPGQNDLSMELYAVRRRVSLCKRLLQLTEQSIQRYVKHVNRHCGHDPFAEDLRDTVRSLLFSIDDLYECTTEMLNLHISFMEYRSNQLLYVLTILTVIFTPITFISSLYGMNFKHFPELSLDYGYYYCLGLMLLTVLFTVGCLRCHRFICVPRLEAEALLV